MSVSRTDDKRRSEEECPSIADIESAIHGSGSIAEMEISVESVGIQRRRILHTVPPQVREENKHIYDPSVVSLGPYHHGKPELRRYEEFKDEVLNIMLNSDGGAKDKGLLFRGEILERIDEIRSFYGGLSTDEYEDEALVEMMVRDACLVLCYMEVTVGNPEGRTTNQVIQSIGLLGISLMSGDFLMLENQIPWWVIKILISLTYDDDDDDKDHVGEGLIRKFLSYMNFADSSILKRVPWEEGTEQEPLHLLDALRTTMLMGHSSNTRRKSSQSSFFELTKRPLRSATELTAMGIRFKRSSEFLNDISFSLSSSSDGLLHLPVLVVNNNTMAFLSNIIVLETSPGSTTTEFPVMSYVNFMKSMIENPKDVKLLQENGILFSYLKDNEQIVRMFKEIDTYGDNWYIFNDIRTSIDKHCSSMVNMWKAELRRTYFGSPWRVISFQYAIAVLCLTAIQTVFTVLPDNGRR